jgi:hypothetical protein
MEVISYRGRRMVESKSVAPIQGRKQPKERNSYGA